MSRRAIKAINWAPLVERIPESEKTTLAVFKTKSDQFLRRMTANPEAAPKIDWAYYKRTITTPGLVDKFQKEYESLTIPYPPDNYTAKIEAEEKETLVKIEEYLRYADSQISTSQQEIDRIKGLLPIAEMTLEDFKDMYPEHAFNPEKPTMWPHTPDSQPPDDIVYGSGGSH
ncbi:ATP synthase subunit d, mitochondrial-like [Colletes gigas]|uniref:ATP synthase subunit d, mitochondrial-like n=1 Tax=Colletes gigas TaxID=935657 RepID=UPI001C9ACF2F|nr:ATP synthase subunit d, mitochondrial-like [Colletes gigas]